MSSSQDRPSDQLAYKTMGLGLAAVGHGAYLGYKYIRYGHVNEISVGVLVFLWVFTLVATGVLIAMRRSEARRHKDGVLRQL